MIDVGRVCLKIAGREAGKYCVVVNRIDENFVTVTGPRELTEVKRRRCNVSHLEPILEVVRIKKDATDQDVLKAYQEANLLSKLNLEPRKRAEPKEKKAQEKKEKPRKAEKKAKAPAKKAKPKEKKAKKK